MERPARVLNVAVLLAASCCQYGLAQVAPTIITIDFENWVGYAEDVFDVSRRAVNPSATPQAMSRNFNSSVAIADIVAVNGQPAKGVYATQSRTLRLLPMASNGAAIADIGRGSIVDYVFEILKSDGTPVGSIMASGFGGGPPPPGVPLAVTTGNAAILGGTGAFLGVRGQAGLAFSPTTGDVRNASMAEDPGSRRTSGGGKQQFVLHLIPHSRPEIVLTSSGPAVAHANDSAPVTDSKPAAPGEELSLLTTGLGPTRPGVNPGKPFPEGPPARVTSPVEVTVNGRQAVVLAASGVPGGVDSFQINFRLPADTPGGMATIQVTAAWISGSEVRIPVQ